MDACWIDYEDKKFYAIELKDYTATGSLESVNTADRKWNITKKVVDTMQMFLAAKYQNTFGQTLENEKNVDLHSFCLEALRGYTKVWDNAHVTVMTYEQARRKLPFVV